MDIKNHLEPEIDFKSVIKTPIRWFGLIYFLILTLIIIGGHFYIDSIPDIEANKIEPVSLSPTKVEEIKMLKGSIQDGVKVDEIASPNDSLILKGKELFSTNCASCHGKEGKGDGVVGVALNPKPRDFTSKDGWKNGRKISELYKTLQEGITGTGMTAYEFIPTLDKFALIHYIRTLSKDFPKDSKEELQNLDKTYSLSQGKQTPSQIPVSMAIAKLIVEESGLSYKIQQLIDELEKKSGENGAIIFKQNSLNNTISMHYLLKSNAWKSDINSFIKYITNTLPDNGFKVGIMKLPTEDWQSLFDFLLIIYS